MAVVLVDLILALGILATSIGIGWLVYSTRVERAKAEALSVDDADHVAALRNANADTLAAAKEGAATLEKAVRSIRAGVR